MGQIATFMDSLHLTYKEVVEVIPYRNLLLMNKDKQRVTYNDVYEEVDEEAFFGGQVPNGAVWTK